MNRLPWRPVAVLLSAIALLWLAKATTDRRGKVQTALPPVALSAPPAPAIATRAVASRNASTAHARRSAGAPPSAPGAPLPGRRSPDALRQDLPAYGRLLTNAPNIAARETPGPRAGTTLRERIVRAEFKYPLLRVSEAVDNAGAILGQTVVAADHLLVVAREGATDAQVQAVARKHGGRVLKRMYAPRHYLIAFARPDLDTVPRAVAMLGAEAGVVESAEPDAVVYALDTLPDDPDFPRLWGLHNTGQNDGELTGTPGADIDAPKAWDAYQGSTNVIVGVLDTGVDYDHEDLQANMWTNPGEIPGNGLDDDRNGLVDDVYGYDFCNDDSDPLDDNRHGTHVSGTIGGVGNNGVGVAGVCWTVRIMALKFLDGGGFGALSDAVDAVRYATRKGARLTSNSWGGGDYNQALASAIAEAGRSNVLFVAAAGNSSSNNDKDPVYPSSYTNANIIAVAATDNRDQFAWFSCWGKTSVDVAAPGVNIWSTVPPYNGYKNLSGTSMATPHVAGACALAWALRPDADAATIKQAILSGAERLASLNNRCVSGGRLNVHRTILGLGMYVRDSTPAEGSIVFSPPTNYTVRFTEPYAANSVQAADFTVNGAAAGMAAFDSPDTVTFRFVASPVTNEGPQTMSLAADSILRASDGKGLGPWTREFRYDAIALAVTSTVPAQGSTVTLPLTRIELRFNEPVDTNALSASALALSEGTVTGVSASNATTLAFAVTNIIHEGTLALTVPAGAVVDRYGNPCQAYAGTIETDVGIVPFPAALATRGPGANLVYDAACAAHISVPGDTDGFTLALDASQKLTVAVIPMDATLQPAVVLLDPSDAVIAGANAAAPGMPAVIETYSVDTPGLYTMVVSGMDGTTGNYIFRPILNAAYDLEPNGSAAAAQDLTPGFLPLGGGAFHTAVVGDGTGAGDNDWYRFALTAGDRLSLAARGTPGLALYTPEGALAALGVPGKQADFVIDDYHATNAGNYALCVPAGGSNYVVSLAVKAVLDPEKKNLPERARALNGQTLALGTVGGPGKLFLVEYRNPPPARIHSVNPKTGAILASFDAPVTPQANPYGFNLAYDGDSLWFNAGAEDGNNVIYRLDPVTGAVLDSFTADYPYGPPYGLASLGDELFLSYVGTIEVYSKTNFARLRELPIPDSAYTGYLEGLAGDTANGFLYGVSQRALNGVLDPVIVRLDPSDGAELTNAPVSTQGYPEGMAVVDGELFVSATLDDLIVNDIVVFDPATFALKRCMRMAIKNYVAGLGGDGIVENNPHWYSFHAAAGDALDIRTFTPAGDPQAPFSAHNNLDPALCLYGPDGSLIGSNRNGAADGKNAVIAHTADAGGTYLVAVEAEATVPGEYVLHVNGATGSSPSDFRVTASTPADGAALPAVPTQMVVTVNHNILLPSAAGGDLTLDGGVPCSGVTFPDGRTMAFSLPVLDEGTHTVAIAAGALQDVAGVPLRAFDGAFTIDLTAPTVIATSISEGGSVPPGALNFQAQFSEALRAGNLTHAFYTLSGAATGPYGATNIAYTASNSTVTLTFADLPQDVYTLTLYGGDGLLEDLAGNDLAGSPFVRHFYVDVDTATLPPMTACPPLGSLVYAGAVAGDIAPAGDTDGFRIALDAGQTLTVLVCPSNALQPTIALTGPAGLMTNTAGPLLQAVAIANAGDHTITVGAAAGTTGGYTLRAILNAAVEEEGVTGAPNDSMPQILDGAGVALPGNAVHTAVWGTGDNPPADGYGYRLLTAPCDFQDIRTTGTKVLTGADEDFVEVTAAQLGGFSFDFYGTTRTNLFISSNGLLTFGSGYPYWNFGDLTAEPTVPAIAALWTDLLVTNSAGTAGVYWQVVGSGTNRQLIVQWDRVLRQYGEGEVTFQAVLSEADGSIQLNFQDLTVPVDWVNEGAYATVGIKDNGTQGSNRLLAAHSSAPNAYVGSGKSLRFAHTNSLPAGLGLDLYAVTLQAGERATLVASLAGAATNIALQLLDGSGAILATGQAATNVHQAIVNALIPSNGVYTARVHAPIGTPYTLAVMRNAGFDIEPNNSVSLPQAYGPSPVRLGHLSSTADASDYFRLYLLAGDTMTARTYTPADGAGEFVNVLNPALYLYDPSGSQVRNNDDGAPDGRNALLSYTATASGNHTLRVRAQAGSGEYILSSAFPSHDAPSVALTQPANFAKFVTYTPISVTATASSPNAAVARVEFYADGAKFTEDATDPYAGLWAGGGAGNHTLLAKAVDTVGVTNSSSSITVTLVAGLDPVQPGQVTDGVNYALYLGSFSPSVSNLDAASPVLSGVTSNFTLNVPGRTTNDYFGLKFGGFLRVTNAGVYTFAVASDEGSRLWIGSSNVVNNDGDHANSERSGTIGLKTGLHPINVSYYEKTNAQSLTVYYSATALGQSKQVIPPEVLWRLASDGPDIVGFVLRGTDLSLGWTYLSIPGATPPFSIWSRTNLMTGAWEPRATNLLGTPWGVNSWTGAGAGGTEFFRVTTP